MYENKDYIMRLIHEIARTLIKLIFNIDIDEYEKKEYKGDLASAKWEELFRLADEGKINEAENRLTELMDGEDLEHLRMALLFYDHVNDYDDEILEQADYSREEIKEGIYAALEEYGYASLGKTLL